LYYANRSNYGESGPCLGDAILGHSSRKYSRISKGPYANVSSYFPNNLQVIIWEVAILGGSVSIWSVAGAALIICVLTANLVRKCFKKSNDTRKHQTTTARVENSNSGHELDGLKHSRVSIELNAGLDAHEGADHSAHKEDVPVWTSNTTDTPA
jgi:hypothetical protein